MDLFRSIRTLPSFKTELCPSPVTTNVPQAITAAISLMSAEVTGKAMVTSSAQTRTAMTNTSVQTVLQNADTPPPGPATPTVCPWEERYDDVQGFNYYFNAETEVSQWEKPEGFDEVIARATAGAAAGVTAGATADVAPPLQKQESSSLEFKEQRARVQSEPPAGPHPSLHQRPIDLDAPEDDDEAEAATAPTGSSFKPKPTLAQKAATVATTDPTTPPVAPPAASRRRSKLIRLGSSLRMTLTWGNNISSSFDPASAAGSSPDLDAGNPNPEGKAKPAKKPFPTTMPPTETEMMEDMSWRVILQSSPEATNGVTCLGLLVLTNYRLLFVPEDVLLASFDPKNSPPPCYSATIEIPIMLIAEIEIPTSAGMFIKTKDSKEFYFNFGETHQSETEAELLEMEEGRESENQVGRFSSAMSSIKDLGTSVAPKKRNQMNSGLKGFLNMTSINRVAQTISKKVMSLATDGSKEGGAKGEVKEKVINGFLEQNGRTKFENFLAGNNGGGNGGNGGGEQSHSHDCSAHDPVPPLQTKLPWTDDDIDIVQGVLSDDGSGLRRFSTRLKYRAFNAQFETRNWMDVHKRLCESLKQASAELGGEEGGGEEEVEIRISGYDYVDIADGAEEYPEAEDDTKLNVSKDWIINSHKIISDGWKVYNIEDEYKRMGVPNDKFRITKINEDFKFSPTYPNVWAVPKTVSDKQLEKAGKHRSKVRMPVLTWVHPVTKASISRCSQPMVGVGNHRNAEDENLLEQYRLVSGGGVGKGRGKLPLVIIDARPKLNAQVNQAAGKGFELSRFYANTELLFMNIGNIHTMRKSVDTMADTCCGRSHDGSSYLNALDGSGWLYHLHKVLRAAVHTAHLVSRRGISCVVHCSDGWDRTAQICALSELIMDPYYRTFKGFQVLIEKDWLTFGFKFADRNGFHPKGGHHSQERSPVFVQFLDCVHQMLRQHPNMFEFNVDFLVEICKQSHMGWFGNFLFNTMREREENGLSDRAISLWTYLDNNKER